MKNERYNLLNKKSRKRKNKNKLLKRQIVNCFIFVYENAFLLFKILFLISNIIYFMINIFILYHSPNKEILKFIKNSTIYRNIDNYTLNLITNSYEEIGNYLNNKYNIYYNSSNLSINKKGEKKTIKVYGVNIMNQEEFERTLLWYLNDTYIVQFDENNPDYLIYNIGDNQHDPKYDNAIKIALYTENIIPDLYQSDYGIGHAHISYLDRYFILPFCFLRRLNETKHLNLVQIRNEAINKPRKKFCAATISNSYPECDGYSFRLKFIEELNKYKTVDMGGQYGNNIGGPVNDKIGFFKEYKFSIAMENTEGDGYATEKIVDSFVSGTIPIYYGSFVIDEYINPKSYILIRGLEDMKEKIEYIKKIDNDDKLYKSILQEKVLIDDNMIEKMMKEQHDFWIHIFNQDLKKVKRKTMS